MLSRFGSSALRSTTGARVRGIHATASASMYFKRMELEVWFDKWQYHCNVDIGESAVKWKTIKDLGIDMEKIELRYGHHTGLPALKDEIAKFYDGLTTDHVIVTSGGSEAIFSIYAALCKPGDHMVCEAPNYPSNYGIPEGLGMEYSLCHMKFEDDYRLDMDAIKSMVTDKTKVLSICHPNNPTGCTLTEPELHEIVNFCKEKDIYLLSDETYREMYLENPPPPACTLYDKAISITSMSKCYGIPGCRIGWLACKDQHLLDEVLTVREYVSITNNSVGEVLATEVLKRGEEMMAEHRGFIASNKKIVTEWVDNHDHIEWVYPDVGVVGFPRLKDHVVEALDHPDDLFVLLADKYRTFTVPGSMMDCDARHFRVGFGAFPEELKQGLQNFDDALAELMPAN